MSWNNGYERKKFEQEQKAQAKEYRKCGMNEEQIQAMYLQDLQEYRNNRIYAIRIQSIEELDSDGEESRNALHKKFLLSMTCTMDMSECGRYGWIDEIENNCRSVICLLHSSRTPVSRASCCAVTSSKPCRTSKIAFVRSSRSKLYSREMISSAGVILSTGTAGGNSQSARSMQVRAAGKNAAVQSRLIQLFIMYSSYYIPLIYGV